MNKTWLEPILARHLGRVKAPDELWSRIQAPQSQPEPAVRPRLYHRKLVWATAGAFAVVASVSLWMWRHPADPVTDNEVLSVRALNGGAGGLDFRSTEPVAVRTWIKSHAGLDVPLPAATTASIRLLGAHSTPAKNAVEILYEVEGKPTVLTVAKVDPALTGDSEHRFMKGGQRDGARTSSWTMRGQMYTVACPYPQSPRAGCLLCHAGGPPDFRVD